MARFVYKDPFTLGTTTDVLDEIDRLLAYISSTAEVLSIQELNSSAKLDWFDRQLDWVKRLYARLETLNL